MNQLQQFAKAIEERHDAILKIIEATPAGSRNKRNMKKLLNALDKLEQVCDKGLTVFQHEKQFMNSEIAKIDRAIESANTTIKNGLIRNIVLIAIGFFGTWFIINSLEKFFKRQ